MAGLSAKHVLVRRLRGHATRWLRRSTWMPGTSPGMTTDQRHSVQPMTEPHNATLVEKTPLETYVPPAKPSLIGLSRTELADRLGEIDVAPAQRKMRVQQLWHWMYFRGARNFDEMTSVSKGIRTDARRAFHRRPARSRGRADLQRRHPQMAAAAAERRQCRAGA